MLECDVTAAGNAAHRLRPVATLDHFQLARDAAKAFDALSNVLRRCTTAGAQFDHKGGNAERCHLVVERAGDIAGQLAFAGLHAHAAGDTRLEWRDQAQQIAFLHPTVRMHLLHRVHFRLERWRHGMHVDHGARRSFHFGE